MKKLKITMFADPVCTWCWGTSPIIRALRFRMQDKIELRYVMGGMIDDITRYNNRRLGIGGDIELSNRNMFKAWTEASAVHGMPVCEHGFHLFSETRRSTVPQNLAYIAAGVYDEKMKERACSGRFLRRLQEATAVDAALTCDTDVITSLAAVEGYDPVRFREIFESREVCRLFDEGKQIVNRYDVQTFPSFLLEYKGTEMMLRGFTTFETLLMNIKQLTYGKVTVDEGEEFRPSTSNVKRFIMRYGSVYPVEIATSFGLARISGHSALNVESYEGLPDIVEELVAQGDIAMKPRGNGFMLYCKKHHDQSEILVDDVVETVRA